MPYVCAARARRRGHLDRINRDVPYHGKLNSNGEIVKIEEGSEIGS